MLLQPPPPAAMPETMADAKPLIQFEFLQLLHSQGRQVPSCRPTRLSRTADMVKAIKSRPGLVPAVMTKVYGQSTGRSPERVHMIVGQDMRLLSNKAKGQLKAASGYRWGCCEAQGCRLFVSSL